VNQRIALAKPEVVGWHMNRGGRCVRGGLYRELFSMTPSDDQ